MTKVSKAPPFIGQEGMHLNHRGEKLQLQDIGDMKNASVCYFNQRASGFKGKVHGYRHVADACGILYETFHRTVKDPFMGLFGHLSAGQGLTVKSLKLLSVHHTKQGSSECLVLVLFAEHYRSVEPMFIARMLRLLTCFLSNYLPCFLLCLVWSLSQ